MTPLDIAGLIVVASALVMYGYMVRTGEAIWFHWINALGGIITTASAYQHRAWPGLLAAVAYGLIGAAGVVKWWAGREREQRGTLPWWKVGA